MASEHTERLAKPKQSVEGPFRDPQWQVSEAAKKASPSDRITELCRAKRQAEGYQPCRDVEWRVSIGARNAVASNRLGGSSYDMGGGYIYTCTYLCMHQVCLPSSYAG